ncbi:methionine adenosyltransferase [Mesorhizobium sp.]|uniref:methionine adenosyltransferase n=1 Tax=Mesorhizobium sp. TaxID=1871066 RepID=UPI000FCBAA3F|nr:hypothetical protein EOA85_25740 [Mesorhizobium sp. M5C.F.Ca.IN.020.29.1.1]RWK53580.1 MAG: hypothetical protein EOR48_21700 [Mesorhizobium sp.]TIM90297.1 MAG: hypothetical protein E5Y50_02725 [Mesorhizobium sp.]TIP45469.1 MAG: hypothetical protein E5X62_12300 [Mesorhizobium sp.]TIP74426.1 MAG: hypothetical protein E5X55_09545 [Mesorhizobium sp.]
MSSLRSRSAGRRCAPEPLRRRLKSWSEKLGRLDTICDALVETFSRSLCREYSRHFDRILHHNLDKALLSGGGSSPAFGGGSVTFPINIYRAGRATNKNRQ